MSGGERTKVEIDCNSACSGRKNWFQIPMKADGDWLKLKYHDFRKVMGILGKYILIGHTDTRPIGYQ